MVLRRIGVWSAARLAGLIYAVIGVLAGLIFALISMVTTVIGVATQSEDLPTWFGALFGVGAIFIFPILYGVMGLAFGALMAALYNLFSGFVGGLELDVLQLSPREN
jgi:uncharacterized membrane protein